MSGTIPQDPDPVPPATEAVPVAREYVPLLQDAAPPQTRARVVCFYLPQFHTIAQNDLWWGDGFTEWTNVRAALPQFPGHYQPHQPGELGHYDLLDAQVQRRQVELARLYGIGGFCFFFYWFGGTRLLETPVRNYLDDASLDLPFCLCWANENWTRRWDGLDSEVLIAQRHSADDDLAFIAHVADYMRDPRYIRVGGRPLLVVYRPSLLPDARASARRWRDWCRDHGIGEILLAATQSFEAADPAAWGFDAAIEYPPNNSAPPDITDQAAPAGSAFRGHVLDWAVFEERSAAYAPAPYALFRGACPAWDNTPRRGSEAIVFTNNTPRGFRRWLENAFADTCRRFAREDARLVFINAWNEWGEGAHLEPDSRHGYAWLQAVRDAHQAQLAADAPSAAHADNVGAHFPFSSALESVTADTAALRLALTRSEHRFAELELAKREAERRARDADLALAASRRLVGELGIRLEEIERERDRSRAASASQIAAMEQRIAALEDQLGAQRTVPPADAARAGDAETPVAPLRRGPTAAPADGGVVGLARRLPQSLRWKRLGVTLRPLHEIDDLGNGSYASTGRDPQFLLELPWPELPPGHYLLRMRGSAESGGLTPLLYLDDGAGYRESLKIEVPALGAGSVTEHWISLPPGVRAIRLDPMALPGRFSIDAFDLILTGRHARMARLLWPRARRALRDPRWGLRMLRSSALILGASGLRGMEAYLLARAGRSAVEYLRWVECYDELTDAERARMRRRIRHMESRPLISVLMPVYDPPVDLLDQAIWSVRRQIYPHWELCIADDASNNEAVRDLLRRHARDDARIRLALRESNGHISAASNSALALATGEFVALLDHDDLLAESALFHVADTMARHPEAGIVYSDEDKIDLAGRRHDPHFKCDWNLHLVRSHNLVCHLGVYRSALVREVGGFRPGLEGAQDYDLALRCAERLRDDQIRHIPRILYHWRVRAGSTALAGAEKPYALLAGERALADHLARLHIRGRVEPTREGRYRIAYALPDDPPLVSIIIPTRNGLALLRRCIESIRDKTDYRPYEIIVVDNGSDDPAALAYLRELDTSGAARILRDDGPFNFSALNNRAVAHARGEFVALVNNDIEVISPGWLREMVSLALLPGTGAVGARLWYANDTLQHGGIILGLGGVAGHAHKHLPRGDPGYSCRALLAQDLSAVTAACLLVRKAVFLEVGGLDERDLRIAFNDVDFCLKLRERGYRNVWTPHAELYHHESASRGHEDTPEKRERFSREVRLMQQRWGEKLSRDPAYSPNLTLDHEDFSLAWPPRR